MNTFTFSRLQAQTRLTVFGASTAVVGAPDVAAHGSQCSPRPPRRVLKQARPPGLAMAPQGARNRCYTNDPIIVATRRPNAARARFVSKPTSGTDENPRTNEGVGIVISVPPPVDRALPRLAHLHQRARSRRRSCRESKAAAAIQIRVAAAAAVAAPSLPHARGKRGARGWWAVQARLLTAVIIVVMLESMSRYYHHCMDLRIASSE
jgi:hypothetical protein